MRDHMVTVDDESGNRTALDDLRQGLFFFVEFGFDLFEAAVALHDDVGSLQKALMDTVFDRFDGNRFTGQVLECLLPDGFQPQQVPQETGVLVVN